MKLSGLYLKRMIATDYHVWKDDQTKTKQASENIHSAKRTEILLHL